MELAEVRNRHNAIASHHKESLDDDNGSASLPNDPDPLTDAENAVGSNHLKRLTHSNSLASCSPDSSSDEESLQLLPDDALLLLDRSAADPADEPLPLTHALLLRQRYVSLEQLNPSHECHTRKSTFVAALFNLVATVCGGGVLSLPLAFARAGILPTTLLMIYAAVTTDFCLYLLVSCARRTGGRSYGDVAQAAFGPAAQLVTTASLATMLFGTLIAYQVLLRDLWATAVYHWLPSIQNTLLRWSGGDVRHADNLLLAAVLVLALPLLLQRDLHALRYTCYVGFSSCVLLFGAVTYRASQKVQLPHAHQPLKWSTTDPHDILFAYPIVLLCFFCSFNVLSIHAQLRHPTRRRVRALLDGTVLLCGALFYGVGLGGYLYAGQGAMDNVLLNFPMTDNAVLAGRSGYCLTILFGLPLVLLPLRDAVVGLPAQVAHWRDTAALVAKYNLVGEERRTGAHLIVNGVDFDSEEPKMLVLQDPRLSHGTRLSYGSTCVNSSNTPSQGGTVTSVTSGDVTSLENPASSEKDCSEHPVWCNQVVHVLTTAVLLLFTFLAAASVPGVAAVWSIFGSSMAIWIGFIVPTACYLKIRERKGLTARSLGGALLLVASCASAVACTRHAVQSALS